MNTLYNINDIRGEQKEIKKEAKKEINFLLKKDRVIKSLKEVEHFLCDFNKATNCVKLFKILK